MTGEHVFGRSVGFGAWSRGKEGLDERLIGKAEPWRLHDIRRTVATRMADLGIMPHVIEAALNHQSGHKRGPAGVQSQPLRTRGAQRPGAVVRPRPRTRRGRRKKDR